MLLALPGTLAHIIVKPPPSGNLLGPLPGFIFLAKCVCALLTRRILLMETTSIIIRADVLALKSQRDLPEIAPRLGFRGFQRQTTWAQLLPVMATPGPSSPAVCYSPATSRP